MGHLETAGGFFDVVAMPMPATRPRDSPRRRAGEPFHSGARHRVVELWAKLPLSSTPLAEV